MPALPCHSRSGEGAVVDDVGWLTGDAVWLAETDCLGWIAGAAVPLYCLVAPPRHTLEACR
jgi:hypothetical protein